MARLVDLPTTFLQHALMANPCSNEFSWGSTRKEIEAELRVRGELEKPLQAIAALPPRTYSQYLPFLCDLETVRKRPTPPLEPLVGPERDCVTAVIFTSYVPSHPSPWVLERIYNSIHRQIPGIRIVVLADGETGEEPESYVEFKANVRKKDWEIVEFHGKYHQTLMLQHVMLAPGFIKTPLVMVCEHDWGINPHYVDWCGIFATILDPNSHFRMIALRADVVNRWEYGFFGEMTVENGIDLLATANFQMGMHVALCDWYRKLLLPLRLPKFLEGCELYNELITKRAIYEMACYIPPGPIGRLYHLNGREVRSPSEVGGIGDR